MVHHVRATALFLSLLLLFFALPSFAIDNAMPNEADSALKLLKDETLSYFSKATGKITSVEGNKLKIDPGPNTSFKKGMRLTAYKEGGNFVHPVTGEPLPKMDIPVGTIEVTSASGHDVDGIIIKGDPLSIANAKLEIPAIKIKMLFYQGDIDWFLGDYYYQMLKATNRFELIDTAIETTDIPKILAEAKTKSADAALILVSKTSAGQVTVEQKLFWVGEDREFAAKNVSADAGSVKELRLKAGFFLPSTGEKLLSFHLPYKADRLAVGNFAGDGNTEFMIASGDKIRTYRIGVGSDLKAMEEFTIPAKEILWMDALDINKDGKEEILISAMRDDEVVSYIYGLQDYSYVQLYKTKDVFLRKLGNRTIAQGFSKREGYDGPVFFFTFKDNSFQKGDVLKLPAGVNIYDFQLFNSPEGKKSIAAWNDNGFMQIYNEQGVRLWASKEDFGGFSTTFSKEAGFLVDRGNWSVKDRLLVSNNELLAPKRKPLVGMAKSLGYFSSAIKGLWWNGSAVEERDFIENAGGNLLDYDMADDRLVVLTKEAVTSKAVNLLKGQSPFGVELYIFLMKGR
jgi:hypothetical protein